MIIENTKSGTVAVCDEIENSPVKVMIVGVGGGGCNAVDNMIDAHVNVNVFMAINTDRQALRISKAPRRVQIGKNMTRGYGAGGNPEKGRLAAEDCRDTLTKLIKDMDLVFITAGMGGGTGTGAAPVIAEIAHSLGKLVVAFVTTPFGFEGRVRMQNAQMGIAKLREHADSIIIVPNERLATVAKDLTTVEAFKYADDILRQGVQALTDIIASPARINVDFADIINVLERGGDAIMAIGRASGTNRAIEAVKRAVNNTVLDTSIEGATRAIVHIEGGDIKMEEVTQATELIRDVCSPIANIKFGHAVVPELNDQLQVTIIATGFNRHGEPAQQEAVPSAQQREIAPAVPTGNVNPNVAHAGVVQPPQQQSQPPQPQQMRALFDTAQYKKPPQDNGQIVEHKPDNSGYVGLDDETDLMWLNKLKNRK